MRGLWPSRSRRPYGAAVSNSAIVRHNPPHLVWPGRCVRARFTLPAALLLLCGHAVTAGPLSATTPPGAERRQLLESYGNLPLVFEANRGQADAKVKFLTRGAGYTVFLTSTQSVVLLSERPASVNPEKDGLRSSSSVTKPPSAERKTAVVRVKLAGSAADPQVLGEEPLPGHVNYFRGKDPAKHRTGIGTYGKVRYKDVYPGIDLLYYGNQKQLEYDFIVAPGSDPSRIRLRVEGPSQLTVAGDGSLVAETGAGQVSWKPPVVYQDVERTRKLVEGRYVVKGRTVSFRLGEYDRTLPLVIDPVLVYSTYLGGSGSDSGLDISVDASGSAYVTGGTLSTDFPTSNAFQADQINMDVFVTKLSPSGDSLVYSTYLGGSASEADEDEEYGTGIAVDTSGSAYVTGVTDSPDFPTQNPYQTGMPGRDESAFVTRLSPSGDSLIYSTYLRGSNNDFASDIAVDASGSAYVTGYTLSPDFPTVNAYQAVLPVGDLSAFVTKLAPSGNSLVYSTFLGGNGFDYGFGIAVDAAGSAYVTGSTNSTDFPTLNAFQADQPGADVFVTKFSPSGGSLVYSTYLGGNSFENSRGIAVDASGSAYVAGSTDSADFPTQDPYQTDRPSVDAFLTRLNPTGNGLDFSTYLGGNDEDSAIDVVLDAAGRVYVTGDTYSEDFPTQNAYQLDQPGQDVFVTGFAPSGGSLLFSTYLGGEGFDRAGGIALDPSGGVYVTGTAGSDFPTLNAYQTDQIGDDAFVTKLSEAPSGTIICPSDIVQPNDPGQCSAEVSFTVTASGSPPPTVTCTVDGQPITSPHRFPVGSTTVTCTATTDAGTDSCSFTVTVNDLEAPSVTSCASTQSVQADANCQASMPDFTAGVVAADNCTPANLLLVTQVPAAGTLAPVGLTPVVITVADAAGNSTTCSTSLAVADGTSPKITDATASPSSLWPPNIKMADITIGYRVSDDCDPAPACTLSVTSNEPIDRGDAVVLDAHHVQLRADRLGGGTGRIYIITITCTDASGNVSTQSVTVRVPHDQRARSLQTR